MLVSIKRDTTRFMAELPWDAAVDEMMDAFVSLMIGQGYMQASIEEWILEVAQEIKAERGTKNIV